MDDETARRLCRLDDHFYREQAASFSRTRRGPWPGWVRCGQLLEQHPDSGGHLQVLDLACGNLRFEDFLSSTLPHTTFDFHAVDHCPQLMEEWVTGKTDAASATGEEGDGARRVHRHDVDIVGALLDDIPLSDSLEGIPPCDLTVCFGFMHHVPTQRLRSRLIAELVGMTRPGGLVCVSFWRFSNAPVLRDRALACQDRAHAETGLPDLDPGDFLLGWQGLPGAWRYCHDFGDEEVDELVQHVPDTAELLDRFVSDGRTDNLNTYIMLRRR